MRRSLSDFDWLVTSLTTRRFSKSLANARRCALLQLAAPLAVGMRQRHDMVDIHV